MLLESLCLALAPLMAAEAPWRPVRTGVEYRVYTLQAKPAVGDGKLHVVRIDPGQAPLTAGVVSMTDGPTRTARQWCQELGLAVAINAGMYEIDLKTHTGFFKHQGHVNNGVWFKNYESVLLFAPTKADLAQATIVDRSPTMRTDDYQSVVQNLRLIKAPGKNVWGKNDRRWSEAAIAQDHEGRILFLFSRSPFTMRDLNQRLLALDLGIVRAMHAEGGPEASLSIHAGGVHVDLCGSYETGFNENDDNQKQWALPNVIGVPRDNSPPEPQPK